MENGFQRNADALDVRSHACGCVMGNNGWAGAAEPRVKLPTVTCGRRRQSLLAMTQPVLRWASTGWQGQTPAVPLHANPGTCHIIAIDQAVTSSTLQGIEHSLPAPRCMWAGEACLMGGIALRDVEVLPQY